MKNETDDVKDVKWGDSEVAGEIILTGGYIVYPAGEDVVYLRCPLCGSTDESGYAGNRFGTRACCYPDRRDGDISLEVERWVTKLLLAGESVDAVHSRLTEARSSRLDSPSFDRTVTQRSYVERISALLLDARTADAYKFYLERTGTMDEWVHEQAADAAGSNS